MGRVINFPQHHGTINRSAKLPSEGLAPANRCLRAQQLVSEAADLLADLGGQATELSWLLEDCLGLLNQFGRKSALGERG